MLIFEIMYWAAFTGKTDILEGLIRNGYSPIINTYKKLKSTIFGCVLGGQLHTLEMILSFTYSPQEKIDQWKQARDHEGNTVMHLAYFHKRDKIAKLLDDHEFYSLEKLYRNHRGHLPWEMNHRIEESV